MGLGEEVKREEETRRPGIRNFVEVNDEVKELLKTEPTEMPLASHGSSIVPFFDIGDSRSEIVSLTNLIMD